MKRNTLILVLATVLMLSGSLAISNAKRTSDNDRFRALRLRLLDIRMASDGKVEERRVFLPRFSFMLRAPYYGTVHEDSYLNPAKLEANRLRERYEYLRTLAGNPPSNFQFTKLEVADGKPISWIDHCDVVASFIRLGKSGRWLFTGYIEVAPSTIGSAPGREYKDWSALVEARAKQNDFPFSQVDNLEDLNWALGVKDFQTYTPPDYR